ncbi:Pycsar system effector family protein [Streptomyces humidus]|uniref:Pycsar system effector family protein n=1 Tax=Streptomyces humidus TaxID=52259 RepID=UPI0033166AC4
MTGAAARPLPQRHRRLHRTLRQRRRTATGARYADAQETVAAMERFLTANRAEIGRADTKAAVLLGLTGAVLGAFIGVSPSPELLRWTAVVTSLLAVLCFVCAIMPRHRAGSGQETAGPGYFGHIAAGMGSRRLSRAFERAAHDPAGPLLASLLVTSDIIRRKYRWVERGIFILFAALPQFAAALYAS